MPRSPLPWLLALEAVVLVALGFLGWRVVSDRLAPPQVGLTTITATPSPHSPAPGRLAAAPVPRITVSPAPRAASPALNTDPSFWQQQLTEVNRDQSAWEAAEWRVVEIVEGFARAYLQHVVMPAVQSAARPRS